jgi:hypothetical protein
VLSDLGEEIEADRRSRIEEQGEPANGWGAFGPGSFGCHELLDRTALVMNAVDEWLLSHPCCLRDPEWYALGRRAFDALSSLYQQVGTVQLIEPRGPTSE